MKRRMFLMGALSVSVATASPILPSAQALTEEQAQDDWKLLTEKHPSPFLEDARKHPERYGVKWSRYEEIMQDHLCACPNCVPSLGDQFGHRGQGHYAIRFFDRHEMHQSDEELMHRYATVTVNGYRIISSIEVMIGNPGTVWIFRGVRDESTKEGPDILNAGYRHTCVTCAVQSADAGLVRDNVLYRQQWSAVSERMVTVRVTPNWGACMAKLTLPNVAATLPPSARLRWEQEDGPRERESRGEA